MAWSIWGSRTVHRSAAGRGRVIAWVHPKEDYNNLSFEFKISSSQLSAHGPLEVALNVRRSLPSEPSCTLPWKQCCAHMSGVSTPKHTQHANIFSRKCLYAYSFWWLFILLKIIHLNFFRIAHSYHTTVIHSLSFILTLEVSDWEFFFGIVILDVNSSVVSPFSDSTFSSIF